MPGCKIVSIPTDEISDWDSFHKVFKKTFGFPDFYGANMNAWIDCMGDDEMRQVRADNDGVLILQLENAGKFRNRCQEQHDALIECIAFVNFRDKERSVPPRLSIMPIGWYNEPA